MKKCYELAKDVYNKNLKIKDATQILIQMGMDENTAKFRISTINYMRKGIIFKRGMGASAFDFCLTQFYNEDGEDGLKKAIFALEQNQDYELKNNGKKSKAIMAVISKHKNKLET